MNPELPVENYIRLFIIFFNFSEDVKAPKKNVLYESFLTFNMVLRYSASALSILHLPTKCPVQLGIDRKQSEKGG